MSTAGGAAAQAGPENRRKARAFGPEFFGGSEEKSLRELSNIQLENPSADAKWPKPNTANSGG